MEIIRCFVLSLPILIFQTQIVSRYLRCYLFVDVCIFIFVIVVYADVVV